MPFHPFQCDQCVFFLETWQFPLWNISSLASAGQPSTSFAQELFYIGNIQLLIGSTGSSTTIRPASLKNKQGKIIEIVPICSCEATGNYVFVFFPKVSSRSKLSAVIFNANSYKDIFFVQAEACVFWVM